MAKTAEYTIKINGLTESLNAVESLNKQLANLEQRMKAINSSKVSTGGGSSASMGGGVSNTVSAEKEINKLKQQQAQLNAKIAASQEDIFKAVDKTKAEYKATLEDQKAIAAQQRVVDNQYTHTMVGMKQKLADLKQVIQTTVYDEPDGQDVIQKYTKEANELANKLKKMEEAYGQFGRNVGNYKSALDGIGKISLNIGGVTREFNNAREATRTLNNELKTMAANGQQDTEAFKQLRQAVMELESNINDAKKPMDDLMDTMESFVALSQTTNGLSAFFGFDNSEIQRSIQKLVGLQNAMQGIQKIQKQIEERQGIGKLFYVGSQNIDRFISRITGAKIGMDGLTMSSKAATTAVRGLSLALKSIGVGVIIYGITMLIDGISKLGEEMNSSEKSANRLDEALKALNKSYSDRRDLITSSYLRGGLSNEELLTNQYNLQTSYIAEQINLLRERMSLMNEQTGLFSSLGLHFDDSTSTYRGGRMNGGVTVESYNSITSFYDPTLKIAVNNIEELEEAWRKCNEAISEGKDYFSKWGKGFGDWFNSIFTTVGDTERAMRELGKVKIGDFIAQFGEINEKFSKGNITAEQFAEELSKLKGELNDNEVLRSVIVNLDKYIPDEKVREAINNIINEVVRLDDSFNMTSPEQVRHWMQVRIDGMKEGVDKIKAQLEADEKYEIAQYGNTQEQIDLIRAKYARKREEQLKRYNDQEKSKAKQHQKEITSAENELARLRIQNMNESLAKEIALLKQEREEKLRAVKENGIKVAELSAEIQKLYEKKILDATKKWAAETKKIYEDLYNNIQRFNRSTFNMEVTNATTNVDNRAFEQKNAADKEINAENRKNIYAMREYYAELLDIENKAAEAEAKIQQERLDRELDYTIKEEELRHRRLVDAQDGEYKRQLEAGKITLEQYNTLIEDENNAHAARMNAIDKEYAAKSKQVTQKLLDEQYKNYSNYYDKTITLIRRKQDEIENELDQSVNKLAKNGFGLFNPVKMSKVYDQAIEKQKKVIEDIQGQIDKLNSDNKAGKIIGEAFDTKSSQLENEMKNAKNVLSNYEKESSQIIDRFASKLNEYIQTVGQSIQQIFQSVWDYQDYMFDKEQDELDKWNEKLDDALKKQESIIDEHKNNIESIEDELATARGDRRQHLIDQLNAEISAERAAQKERQRIEKEQEQATKKQEALDKKRREQEHDRQVKQAFINWHLSIASGLATQPFFPVGIAMGALATALGAVQYALVKSQKPYAKGGQLDGGVAQGARHRDGGIPVLGGRASIEGGEFITNRRTTAQNVDLLEFVNSKHRKLSIDDFIDFYSTTPRKVIRGVRTKFEDGGYLPTLPSTLDVKDQLQNIVINQDNRPIVVSVVDINNKQDQVRRVQTLAGL